MGLESEARYYMEHKALPKALYNEGPRLLAAFLCGTDSAMVDFYRKAEKANPEYICPYNNNDFSVISQTYKRGQDSVLVVRIGMPKPEAVPLCRAIYLCYGSRSGFEFYLTSELSEDGGFLLCGWSRENMHFNFGAAPEKNSAEMDRAADLFWEMVVDGGIEEHKSICSS